MLPRDFFAARRAAERQRGRDSARVTAEAEGRKPRDFDPAPATGQRARPADRAPAAWAGPGPFGSGLVPAGQPRHKRGRWHISARPAPQRLFIRETIRERDADGVVMCVPLSGADPTGLVSAYNFGGRPDLAAYAAELPRLAAVREQWIRVGADTTGAPIFCHVADPMPAAFWASLSGADKRALLNAKHRAKSAPRVELDPAAFDIRDASLARLSRPVGALPADWRPDVTPATARHVERRAGWEAAATVQRWAEQAARLHRLGQTARQRATRRATRARFGLRCPIKTR